MAPCCCARNAGMDGVEKDRCGDCRIWEEKFYWKRFKSFHFCHNLSLVTDFHHQLAIPKKVAENARSLPPEVTLRGPSGATWSGVITKRGDELLLIEGWVDFVRAYSLQATDILIFKFDGISVFDILIFDGENLCEKESAYFVKKRTVREADIEEDEDVSICRPTKKGREEVAVNETPSRSNCTRFSIRLKKKHLQNVKYAHFGPKKSFPLKMSNHSDEIDQPNVQNEVESTEINGNPETEIPINEGSSTLTSAEATFEGPVTRARAKALQKETNQVMANSMT